jgi:CoA:oxalate CoA-transferase
MITMKIDGRNGSTMTDASRPLAGIHVLDFGMNIAGPEAASLLADLGADVVKVEGPGGDSSRGFTPASEGVSALFASMNRNKRYLGLDLTQPAAQAVLVPLLEWSDIVIQNLRPGKAAELGFSAERCHEVNPRIVHVDIEAFYPPERTRPGYDLLVQAETGMMSLTGSADREPSRLPGSLLDHVTGLWAAFGVVSALHGDRQKARVQLSMSDIALHMMAERAVSHLLSGEVPTRMGSALGTTTALRAYPTADGDIVVGAANDRLFRRLAAVVAPELVDDPDYATQGARLAHRDKLDEELSAGFSAAPSGTWLERLDAAGIPVGRIRDFPEAVARHRDMSRVGLVPVEGLPDLPLIANPLGAHAGAVLDRPRALGADSRDIVTGLLGFDAERYLELEAAGVVVSA